MINWSLNFFYKCLYDAFNRRIHIFIKVLIIILVASVVNIFEICTIQYVHEYCFGSETKNNNQFVCMLNINVC